MKQINIKKMMRCMKQVNIDKIIVNKQLQECNYKTDIHETIASIKMFGQLVPIVVCQNSDGTYRLIAGERQLLAAKKLGWKKIGVVEKKDVGLSEQQWQMYFVSCQYITRQELEKMMGSQYQLHVGDCIEVMKKELSDDSVDLIITDPPFDIDMRTDITRWSNWKKMIYDKSYRKLMMKFFQEAFRVLRHGRHCYVFCGWEWIFYLMELAESCGFICPGAPGVWVRSTGTWKRYIDRLSSNYYQIMFAVKTYPETNKWQDINGFYDAAFYDITRESSMRYHPAEAPVELFQRFINLSSVKHEIVLDPFCGSGSCGVAAIYNKRRFIGIDIEPKWIQLTKLRIEEAIGGQQK